jgi:hypothetical protein
MSAPPPKSVLLLGAGQLGTSLLISLSVLPSIHITLGTRTPSKHTSLASPSITLLQIDLSSPSPSLAQTFSTFDILISATGFAQSPSTLLKLTDEVLEAARIKRKRGETQKMWFFPWQFGVDYDVTLDNNGLMPLFGAQKRVRDMLRAQSDVSWTVVSTGIFTSFLFEPFWGIVDREHMLVRALGSWQHRVTVTHVDDIGRVVARIVAEDVDARDRIVYVAGDTLSYKDLAGIVERVSGKEVGREVWSVPYLDEEVCKDPEDEIKKYRLVFAGAGVWWDKEGTVNEQLQMKMVGVEEYARGLFESKTTRCID